MRSRKVVGLAALLLAAVVLPLSGCSSAPSGPGEITVWARDFTKDVMQKIVDEFNATHKTQAELALIPAAQFVQKFGTAASAKSGPDVIVSDVVFDPYFASVGALKDITKEVQALPYLDQLSTGHLSQGVYKGKNYSLPFRADVSVLYWNKALFAQAGLDPDQGPANYAEFVADAKAVAALGGDKTGYVFSGQCGGCNMFSLTPFIWASGGDVIDDTGKIAKLDSPEVTDALKMYRELWTSGSVPALVQTDTGAGAGAPFLAGDAGMRVDGTGFLNSLVTTAPDVDFGVEPVPGRDGGQASFAGGENVAIASGTDNFDGAWEFLEFATSDAQDLLAENDILPVRYDTAETKFVTRDDRYQVFLDALKKGRVTYGTTTNEIFIDGNGVWSKLVSDAVFGDGDIKAAQATAQDAAQAILDDADK